ncbi:prephenate dehydratase [Microcoleus sp. LEGE 07076]|uniref:prephenate dehydratase n=1 Tax=Microcoleus sp. LEGE 07076 TaxID=915322 RepID=UPI001881614E|nr:prephenate dehydratase [Microcoleus sp. LEGE 07076]MBE9184299.1 prephenate dehydratase [Microcoleus sp. LEGE 07076]
MKISLAKPSKTIAHLGPIGTNAETAALAYVNCLSLETNFEYTLCPYSTISQALEASASGLVDVSIVPVENSIEGSVTVTLDTLWRLDGLGIQHALVLPISHALLSNAQSFNEIQKVYSHPQALAQCQLWLSQFIPGAELIPANSTTEALQYLEDRSIAAISAPRAAELYKLPVLASPINDYPDNYTRFWVLSKSARKLGNVAKSGDSSITSATKSAANSAPDAAPANCTHTSLAFSVPANRPGSLVKPLQVFASRGINLSRIESRPTKRSLGEYIFFMDVEADACSTLVRSALEELKNHTETLKIFGSYTVLSVV